MRSLTCLWIGCVLTVVAGPGMAGQIAYDSQGFEPPTFTSGVNLHPQDGWDTDNAGLDVISTSDLTQLSHHAATQVVVAGEVGATGNSRSWRAISGATSTDIVEVRYRVLTPLDSGGNRRLDFSILEGDPNVSVTAALGPNFIIVRNGSGTGSSYTVRSFQGPAGDPTQDIATSLASGSAFDVIVTANYATHTYQITVIDESSNEFTNTATLSWAPSGSSIGKFTGVQLTYLEVVGFDRNLLADLAVDNLVVVVPEPGAVSLLTLGVLGLVGTRRRKP